MINHFQYLSKLWIITTFLNWINFFTCDIVSLTLLEILHSKVYIFVQTSNGLSRILRLGDFFPFDLMLVFNLLMQCTSKIFYSCRFFFPQQHCSFNHLRFLLIFIQITTWLLLHHIGPVSTRLWVLNFQEADFGKQCVCTSARV